VGLLAVNFVCNNDCSFCSAKVDPRAKERIAVPGKEKLLEIIDSMAADGERELKLSGGEPTVRKDLCELVSHAKEKGFSRISLDTNGRLLCKKPFVEELAKAGINSFEITLLGSNSKTHDLITRRKKSFSEALKGLKNACSLKEKFELFVSVNFIILKQNLEDIPEMGPLLNPLPIDVFGFVFVKPLGRAKDHYGKIAPSYTNTRNQIARLKTVHDTVLQDMPFCVLRDLKPPFFTTKQQYADFVFLNGTKKHSHNMTEWAKKKSIKPVACGKCIYLNECPGTWPEYLKIYGSRELIPLDERIEVVRE